MDNKNSVEHFQNKGFVYLISKDKYESREDTIKRGWFIAKDEPNKIEEYDIKNSESYINLYKTKYNCNYNQLEK